jgi:hypothetical protein
MTLNCYRCGTSLAELSLPLSRLDSCPSCSVDLHVCRMCFNYAPGRPDDCSEEDAAEVRNKTAANFCDYFVPDADVFDGSEITSDRQAREQLAKLFDDDRREATSADLSRGRRDEGTDPDLEAANELFKK